MLEKAEGLSAAPFLGPTTVSRYPTWFVIVKAGNGLTRLTPEPRPRYGAHDARSPAESAVAP